MLEFGQVTADHNHVHEPFVDLVIVSLRLAIRPEDLERQVVFAVSPGERRRFDENHPVHAIPKSESSEGFSCRRLSGCV